MFVHISIRIGPCNNHEDICVLPKKDAELGLGYRKPSKYRVGVWGQE